MSTATPSARAAIRCRAWPAGARAATGAGCWLVIVVAGAMLGRALYADDPLVRIGNAPLVGAADLRLSPWILPAVALAALAVTRGPALAASLSWRALLATTTAAAALWTLGLALGDAPSALTAPLESRYEYLAAVDRVGSPTAFLGSFTDVLATYPTHVKGHPPGLLLLLAGLDAIGLGGSGWATVLVIGGGALAVPAALVAHRALAGEDRARAAAPFLVLLPGAVWVGTSADALFMGVAAAAIALFALAATVERPFVPERSGKNGRSTGWGGSGVAWSLAAGIVLGIALHLSYGIAPLGAIVVAIAIARRAWRATACAALGLALVTAVFTAAGFSWFDGLAATRELYFDGVASRRPYLDFVVIGLAAFALVVGPAMAAGLARLRDRGTRLLCGAACAGLAAAALSGLSRGETERIWLPFAPWLVLATSSLRGSRAWLASAAALGLALQLGVRSPW